MKPLTPSPSFLVRNHFSYCFRMRIPHDLQAVIKKTELRYSLQTGYLGLAKARSRLLAGLIQQLFMYLRELKCTMKLDSTYINDIINVFKGLALHNYVSSLLADIETPSDVVGTFGSLLTKIAVTRNGQQSGSSPWVNGWLDDILTGMGYKVGIDIDQAQYQELSRTLMKVTIEHLKGEKERLKTEYPELELDRQFNQQLDPSPQATETEESVPHISELVPPFIAEGEVNWKPKVKGEVESSLKLLIEAIGDLPIQSVTRAKMADYKKILMKLPPNRNKSPKFRDKTIAELLGMEVGKTLSVERVNKNLERAAMLFDYAIRHGKYHGPNPATKMQLPKPKKAKERRASFTLQELQRLFGSTEYLQDEFEKSYRFWIPLLALFHGMRLGEISGLLLTDIQKSEDGVWIMSLTDRDLKTEAANRVVPLHPFLIDELHFIPYVEKLKKAGQTQLFPELKPARDGYGKNVSRWFNEQYKVKCGITSEDGRLRDFHSFRGTFITHLRHKKVHDRLLKEVVGHSVEESVTDIYTEAYPPRQLFDEIISKVDFHLQIDLSHLKKSKWVVK